MENKKEKPLKTARESKGLTQDEAAQSLGISKSMIGYYESGTKKPSLDKFIPMAALYGVSLKTLAEYFGYDTTQIPNDEG